MQGRPDRVSFFLPQYEDNDNDDSFSLKVIESLLSLDDDPKSVVISCYYFEYIDNWQGDSLFNEIGPPRMIDPPFDFVDGMTDARAACNEARTHLSALRTIIHNDRTRVKDIQSAKEELCLNLIELRNLARNHRRRRNRSSAPMMRLSEMRRYSALLIEALQEVLDYDGKRRNNRPPPDLWMDDNAYLVDVRLLVTELRQLNSLLAKKPTLTAARSVSRLQKHFDTFFGKFSSAFGTTLGIGAASLLIGSAGALMSYAGLGDSVVNQILSHLKR